MSAETLLKKLIEFNTVNDPANNIFPEPDVLEYVQEVTQTWNPDLKAELMESQGYFSIFLACDPMKVDILFMGHLDVVPVGDGWTSNPFTLRIESGLGYGRGSKDCKGSVVSSLLMLEKLCKENSPSILNQLGFFFSMDEEIGGRNGAQYFFNYLSQKDCQPKYVINVDGGPRVVHKRRAGFGVKIKVPPKVSNSYGLVQNQKCYTRILGDDNRHSAYFVRGSDTHCVVVLSKLLHLHRDWVVRDIEGAWIKGNVIPDYAEASIVHLTSSSDSKEITYDENLTTLLRNIRSMVLIDLPTEILSEFGISVNPNIISYSASEGTKIYFDVRAFLSAEKTKTLCEAFTQRLGTLANEAEVTCSGTSGYFHTSIENPLVTTASKVLEKYSLPSEACEQEGASDARYVPGIPVIDLGPKGGNIHGSNEFIDLSSMKLFSSIYEEIVTSLLTS